jgi:hypothetical protein
VLKILKSDDHQDYLNSPLREGMTEKVSKLFSSSHINRCYHASPMSESYNKVNEKDPPKGPVYPPFLPSFASNTIDVRKYSDHKSRFDPDSANAAILAPPLYV